MTIGDSSPAVTATIASSSSLRPSATRPRSISRMPLVLGGEREQVGVAEALADRGRLGRGGDRGLVVAGRLVLEHPRQQEVALLDAVAVLALDEPPRALRTSPPRGSDRAASRLIPTQNALRAAASPSPRSSVRVMGALERGDVLVVAPEHVGRRRQQLEVLGRSAADSAS